jgi:hypothetical protein
MAKRGRGPAVAVGVLVGAALGWALAPVVDMTRHGTLDQQKVRAWRETRPRVVPRGEELSVPAPRSGGTGASAPAMDR